MFRSTEKLWTEPTFLRSSGTRLTPAADDLARRRVCNVCPGQTDRSGVHMAHARDRFDQLRLAVAVDAGNAVDLALADRQIDIFKTGSQPVSGDAQIMDL